ncbi:MAG: glycosyltransferase [Porphyromonas sp.]|nr:glycosyltransferase [Porphyromonas sp.]
MDNNKAPLLSIITPMYNSEAFLSVCIESVLNQEYKNIEFIIVDDASTDQSYAIAAHYAKQDARIRLIRLEQNGGQSVARNRALDVAKGELITFIDSDDAIEPCTYADAIGLMQSDETIDLVQFPVRWGYATHREEWIDGDGDILVGPEEIMSKWTYKQHRITWINCDKIFRAKLLDGVSFYPGVYFEDNLVLLEVMMRVNKMAFTHTGAYRYYLHSEQKLEWREKHSHDSMLVQTESIRLLREHYPALRVVRAEFYSRIANACVIDAKVRGRKSKVALMAKACLREASLADIFGKNRLSPKAKLKIFALKIWSMLS